MEEQGAKAENIAELLNRLSPEKRALLASRLSRKRASGEKKPLIPRSEELDVYPLSFAQQRLWFLEQLEPGVTLNNIPLAVQLRGQLNVTALEDALSELVRRHHVLRATFTTVAGEPVQIIQPARRVVLPIKQLDERSETEAEVHKRLIAEEAWQPFDLERGPLLRVSLMRLDERHHLLLLCMHHIICDGWSVGVLMQELAALYEAFSKDAPSPLAELPLQYTDFAIWQRDWLRGETLETELAYWRRQLQNASPVLDLPTDHARPPLARYLGATQSIILPQPLAEDLEALSRQEGVTLFMLLLATFKVLLYRYTGQSEIVVGTPIAGRTHREVESLIGLFVNTLVLRTTLSRDASFLQVLKQVRDVALSAFAHQSLPFEKLVDELQPERSVNRTPIFQVLFVLQDTPRPAITRSDLTLTQIDVSAPGAKFDLTLTMEQVDRGLLAAFTYNTDLFDAATIRRMLGQFEVLLEGIVANPSRHISQLPLLTSAEWQLTVEQWNNTAKDIPLDQCVHEMIALQAARSPGAKAVVYEGMSLTYEELNRRANQLGHHLRQMGVGPDDKIGICVEPSLETMVGVLGILKAGAAYVGLDPSLPQQRLAFMLEDSQAPVLLSQQRLVQKLPLNQARVVCLDSDWPEIARHRESDPVSGVTPANLAHVIYTSGSTGTPKAVGVEHEQLLYYLDAVAERLNYAANANFVLQQNLSVDAPITFLYGALLAGGVLHVISAERTPDPQALGDYFREQQIDYFKTAPSHMTLLLTATHPERVMPRRLLLLGGEASHTEWIETLKPLAPDCTIVNHYGPTEATVGVSTDQVPKGNPGHQCATLPLGCPLANSRLYILDPDFNPVPIGVPAELHIGGGNVARGYLNRPDLTAEKFIPDPFSRKPGARLYRTGDLARHLPDGRIEFLGRTDHQVKIRGFRIELEEVEAVLEQHPATRSSIVLATDNGTQDKYLVACILTRQGMSPTMRELRSYLREKLPDYMIPQRFLLLDEFPRTPHGKVDRRGLLALAGKGAEEEREYEGLLTGEEEYLLALCEELLGVRGLSLSDNFFEVGGHSLMGTQLVARLRQSLQIEVPLRALFEVQSLGAVAERIKQARAAARGVGIPPLRRRSGADGRPQRLSFAQQRLWFLEQLTPGTAAYNMRSVIRLRGELDRAALERSLNEIVRRHETLRTRFAMVGGEPVQVVAAELRLELAVESLQHLAGAELERQWRQVARAEGRRAFDLERGPLLRARLLELGGAEHLLLLTMHHIISDGWSLSIVARELGSLYEAYRQGQESPLAELQLQYGDYAEWQREWLQGEVQAEQLGYWERELAELGVMQLPTDRVRPAVPSYQGASYSLVLEPELSEQVRQASAASGVTLFMMLLGAFAVQLWRYSGAGEVVVGTPIANRQEVGLEELIGFFVNTLVLRVKVDGEESYRELLGRVREVALAAYAHQDVPFERVVEELQPTRDLSRNPLFQVLFVLQNVPQTIIRLPHLSLADAEPAVDSTRFDLELHVWDRPEGLRCVWIYRTELYEGSSIERMAGHYRELVAQIMAHPELPISRLQYLSEAERKQVLGEWNRTERGYARLESLAELVEVQAERTPEQVALSDQEQALSYRELNERANQLAHYLRGLGVGPEVLVGLLLERGVELVVAVLGVLKAGGAYVPLDGSYPEQRLAQMLGDAQVQVVLSGEQFSRRVEGVGARVVQLGQEWAALAGCAVSNPERQVSGANLAYVIYTSGSTGQPKGVAIEQRNAVNFVQWAVEQFGEELSVVLASTSVCFDLSVFELLAPLSCGGQVVLAENALHLSSLAEAEQVRLINTVPSAMAALVRLKAVPAGVRVVNLAGEALAGSLVAEVYANSGVRQVYNLYGPTEYTTYTTCGLVERGRAEEPSIGRPIANTEVYILDEQLQPAAVGVTGELYLGGAGLARGYLGQAARTAERFVPHPYSREGGARLYRTGDLGRYRADGEIEYLGRMDQQVKLRGYRIELEEVEAVLRQHPEVSESVVVLRAESSGDKRLVAYVVPRLATPDPDTLADDGPRSDRLFALDQSLTEQEDKWQLVWDETYRRPPPLQDPHFNIVGWTSSYTGLPIPQEQMREWLDHTVNRILVTRPMRVIEIGAGTGLLLFRIAPSCAHYYATDFSAVALQYLEQQIAQLEMPPVTLLQRRADDFSGFESGAFDAVILNSVVQYFPSISYLLLALKGAVNAVRTGGCVFIGDVRSFPLLEALHASVQLRRAASSLSRAQFRQHVQKSASEEQELVVAPAFFYSMQQRLPEVSFVEVKLKRGRFHNELTRFRYDVILHVGTEATNGQEGNGPINGPILDWREQQLTLPELRQLLVERGPETVRLKNVPNARLEEENRTLEWLAGGYAAETVGQWRSQLRELAMEAIDPEELSLLNEELPYDVDITYSAETTRAGCFDVTLTRRRTNPPARLKKPTHVSESIAETSHESLAVASDDEHLVLEPLSRYANNPLRAESQRKLLRQLRSFVATKLPDYMMPSTFVFLDAFPLTPNGKIDRRALPAPGEARPDLDQGFVVPRTEMEELLASIWSQVLVVERVGVFDNFFELGGDSILSIQIVVRAQEQGIKLTPRHLFQNQTVAALAAVAEAAVKVEDEQGEPNSPSNFKDFGWDAAELQEITTHIERSAGTASAALKEGRVEDFYPLSSTQEGMLFHTLREPGSNLYLHQLSAELQGRIDVSSFVRAWRKVLERHDILRTSFLWEGLRQPIQVVERDVDWQVQIDDWSDRPVGEREAHLRAFIEADGRKIFSFAEAPLMRVALIRLEEQRHVFIWTHHHVLLDGWSLNLVLKEVLDCYEAYRQGIEPSLAQAYPYRDYIAWLHRQERSASESFWRNLLNGFTTPTTLATNVPRTSGNESGTRYGDEQFRLSPAATAALRTMAQQHQLTLSTVIQGVWALLLSRYTGEDDVVFGVVVSGRPTQLAGVESMVGLFINTLPVRVRVDGEEWLLSWLQKLQEQEVEMREQQHTPLVEVQGWSEVPRKEPLFESIVSVDNYPVDVFAEQLNAELKVQVVTGRQRSNYPLAVVVMPGIELTVRISYDRHRFHSETIKHLLSNFPRILNRVATRSHVTLNAIQIIKEDERKLVRKTTKVVALDEDFDFPTEGRKHSN